MTPLVRARRLVRVPQLQCHHCGAPVRIDEPIGREQTCDACARDLRCCINCRHYDTHYDNSCRETMADPVEDKSRRNFCEYFSYTREPLRAAGADKSREAAARSKLDALFGVRGAGAPGPSQTARDKLEGLFKKPEPPGTQSSGEAEE